MEYQVSKSNKQIQLEEQGCVFRGQEFLDNHEFNPAKECYCGRPNKKGGIMREEDESNIRGGRTDMDLYESKRNLEFAYKRAKVLADMLGIPVHESPEVTGTILGLVRAGVERLIAERDLFKKETVALATEAIQHQTVCEQVVDSNSNTVVLRPDELLSNEAYAATQWTSFEEIQEIVTKFFYWWHNQPGANTADGFTEWLGLQARCMECGARTPGEAETKCICSGEKDHCHGSELWPEV